MDTLICAGGSGSRVLEAVLHLCAAGLGPSDLRLLLIDPDGGNGNVSRSNGLLEKYLECQATFAGKLGPELELFRTKLDLLDIEGKSSGGLKNWSPVHGQHTLREVVNYYNLQAAGMSPDVVDLLFTGDELDMPLNQGFRGRTGLGSAAMSLVALHREEQPWKQLVQKIEGDLSQRQSARVYLVGSVFGGTGASTLLPIARFLRSVPQTDPEKLRIGAAALTPYFRFARSTTEADDEGDRLAAKSELFPLTTRDAASFYRNDYEEHLRHGRRWHFDVMHWVGDSSPVEFTFAKGGPEQRNPAHFVELLAGLACLQFFREPDRQNGFCYTGPRQEGATELGEDNPLGWQDVPLGTFGLDHVQLCLHRFVTVGLVHLGFQVELLERGNLDREAYCVPWYFDRFAVKGDRLSSATNRHSTDLLTEFFREYHLPWWDEVHELERVRLFNRTAVEVQSFGANLDRLTNLLWTSNLSDGEPDAIDDFLTEMIRVPRKLGGDKGGAAYLAILCHAADRYIRRNYRKEQ